MSITTLNSGLSGALFGAALTAAGIYSPGVIIGQLKFENFHMLKTFLTASASSAIIIVLAQKLNLGFAKPRPPNSLGLFSTYDGNLIGGALLGVGLALTGACPGTVLPQVAAGVPSGPLVLLGGVLGGILYSKLGTSLQKSITDPKALTQPTVHQQLGWSRQNAILLFESLALGIVAVSNYFYPDSEGLLIPAIAGGLLVGLSQGTSLLLTGNTLGISSAYEQIGDVFWWLEKWLFGSSQKQSVPTFQDNVLFALGTIAGSLAVSRLVDMPPPVAVDISPVNAIAGGAIMIFGSRIAGGCTSGHGISGMSQLSISSIITVAAMFGAGIVVSALL